MTTEQINAVCMKYDEALAKHGAQVFRESDKPGSLNHLRWMCQEIICFTAAKKTDKAFRWLGFVQGALWTKEIFNIEQLKDDNR
jgi:hypothetical protein